VREVKNGMDGKKERRKQKRKERRKCRREKQKKKWMNTEGRSKRITTEENGERNQVWRSDVKVWR
jgi:hypothetical protein